MDVWKPNGGPTGSQSLFLTCPIFECLLEGGRGGGKTDALLMSFAQHVGRGFGQAWRGALFRLTYPQLSDVVAKSRRWFNLIFPEAQFNKAAHEWTWPTGEALLFRHGASEEDYWNYHGHEYPWLGFEELTNWPSLAFFLSMQSTCRSSHPHVPRMVRATCNPFGRGHGAVKERYRLGVGGVPAGVVIREPDQRPRVRIHSELEENKALLAAEPDYRATFMGLTDINRRRAWLNGDWDIHVGSFLEGVWDTRQCVVAPFAIPPAWKVWKSMDWGFARPYAVYWFAMDHDGVIYVWRELYGAGEGENVGTRESASEVAAKIKEVEKHDARLGYEYRQNLADPSIFARTGADRSIGQIFRDAGVRWQEAWNGRGARVNGAQEIIRLLTQGQLKVFQTCKHLIRTVPALAPDHLNPEDVDSDAEDHAWDALRYGVMRRRRVPEEAHQEKSADPEARTYPDADGNFRIGYHE